jgi:hypothetical protein
MYRTGWASRVLLGVLALLMVAVAIGVLARTLREVGDRAAGPASERSADPVDPEMAESPTTQTPAAATPTQRRTSRATPTPGVTLTSGAIAPGYYQMMPLATYGNSYCVGAGPEQGNSNRRDVAVLSLCANVVPASSALRRTGANTYQIYWADPAGGGGCLQVDHTENGEPATADVYLVAPHDYCDQPDQRFILEPVTTKHGQGYRLHTATAPQLCIGTLSGYTAEGTAISQATCAGSDTEIFIFQNA